MMEIPECRECGIHLKQNAEGDLCLHCRSEQTHCNLNQFGHKVEGFSIPVPWCFKHEKRAFIGAPGCRDCEYNENRGE